MLKSLKPAAPRTGACLAAELQESLQGSAVYNSGFWAQNIGIMENQMETTIMENQMEKKMENEMETREFWAFCRVTGGDNMENMNIAPQHKQGVRGRHCLRRHIATQPPESWCFFLRHPPNLFFGCCLKVPLVHPCSWRQCEKCETPNLAKLPPRISEVVWV